MGWISPNFITILVVLGVSATVCFFDLIQSDLAVFTFVLAGWVASVCLHEFGHAVAAWYGGDRSVAHKGYLNLDPVQYVDPVNSILLPVVVLALGGIGLPGAAVYIETRFIRAIKKGTITRRLDRDAISDAVEAGVLTEADAATLRLADQATDRAIRVDDFAVDELGAQRKGRPLMVEEAAE